MHAQFAVWYLTLVLSRRGILGVWSPSLGMPDAAAHFWLAVCTGACLVRLLHWAQSLIPACRSHGAHICLLHS